MHSVVKLLSVISRSPLIHTGTRCAAHGLLFCLSPAAAARSLVEDL